jgi:centrosomal protein CEP120
MTVDVLHRERLTDDLLLGRAHVPLAPLLQESWVDGRAGVFALLPAPGSRGSSALEGSSKQQQQQHERVQVGTLHLVMSLEEAGPAGAEAAPAGAEAAAALAAAMPAQELVASGPSAPPAGPSLAAVAATSVLPRSRASSAAAAAGAPQQELAVQPPAAVAAGDCFLSSSAAGGPEFEAAWEVELWKRSEEATWRQELKQREGKRMVGGSCHALSIDAAALCLRCHLLAGWVGAWPEHVSAISSLVET